MHVDIMDDKLADFAAKVSNDIAENIDCRETRKQLREVVRFYSLQSCENYSWRRLAEDDAKILRIAIRMLLSVAKSRSNECKTARRIAKIALKE